MYKAVFNILLAVSWIVLVLSCSNEPAVTNKKKVIVKKFDDGSTQAECDCFKNEKADGECFLYYPSGKINAISHWKNGLKEGKYKTYYETGEIKLICYFKQGIRDSLQTEYYLSGKIKSKSYFKNNLPEGDVKEYFGSGNLLAHYYSIKGKANGKYTFYYDTIPQIIREEGIQVDGKKRGTSKIYDKKGILIEEIEH